ncbi:MAG: DUF3817 domain-containing protein [Bacteroidota bacterium]
MNLKTPIDRLRLLAILEGISYLLLGITMPLKYMWDITTPNYVVGMAHGWLFILYIFFSFQCIIKYQWNMTRAFFVLAASLIPFGTFVLDHKILKPFKNALVEK